jgi:hypothetical protein
MAVISLLIERERAPEKEGERAEKLGKERSPVKALRKKRESTNS